MLATFIVIREPASDSYSPSLEDLHSFSWLLFLVAKHRLLPPDKDLVSLFSLLLPVIAAVYELVPLSCRLLIDNNQNAQSTGCLPALVQKFKGSPAEVSRYSPHSPNRTQQFAHNYVICRQSQDIGKLQML